MRRRSRYLAFLVIAGCALAAETKLPYAQYIEQWRAAHAESLKSDSGWLNVAGLFWLKEGPNRAGTEASSDIVLPDGPKNAGVFTLHGSAVRFRDSQGNERLLKPN